MSDYELSGPKWAGATVSWYYSGNSGFSNEIAEAFARWDAVIDLDFVQAGSSSTADIDVSFSYIDGPWNTLAYASSVWSGNSYTGDSAIVFDTAEAWNYSSSAGGYVLSGGETFFAVALHEIGHAIGLDHPTNSSVIMSAYASTGVTDLTYWDIFAGQLLYGVETTLPATPPVTPTPPSTPGTPATPGTPTYPEAHAEGTPGNDYGSTALIGTDGDDAIFAYAGNDEMFGNAGNDVLVGGMGHDVMSGGDGYDAFIFNSRAETPKGAGRDMILDFEQGIDDINLRAIDAKKGPGNQNFKFIANKGFHQKAGELHFQYSGGDTIIEGDIDGNGRADLQIVLSGIITLSKGDFIL